MVMLAEQYEYVIGGDPDRDTIDIAVLDTATGVVRGHRSDDADAHGYRQLLDWAIGLAPGRRVWALEGTGSFAAGLATMLARPVRTLSKSAGANVSGARKTIASTPSARRALRLLASTRLRRGRAACARRCGRFLLPGRGSWSAGRRRSTSSRA